jgi:hypothetical protein
MDRHRSRHRELGRRVREIRRELYGETGVPMLAEELGLPARTWWQYESGVVIPATVLLRFIAVTGADPGWLWDGRGDRYTMGEAMLTGRA